MINVTRFPRKPRPLHATYSTSEPYVVVREDEEDGSITYDVMDNRPESYRFVCGLSDRDNSNAKYDAEQIVRALNLYVQVGKEKPPVMREIGDLDDDD